ncbi:MAG: hypothetical protein JST28_14690 [Acidobacteria bacterium]|nr:hypothetical protein [Acidobacteriota bacterium]
MTMALDVLTLLTTLLCAFFLLRAYHNVRKRLLLWSGLCFIGLAVANALRIADLRIFLATDLYTYRLGTTAVAMCLLLWGLVWESQ